MAIQIDVQQCIATPKLFGCLCAQMNQPHLCDTRVAAMAY